MKIVKSLKESDLLIKGVTKTIKNEVKVQKGGFLSVLFYYFIRTSNNIHYVKVELEQANGQLEQTKAQLKLARKFNAASFFCKF